jgi:glycosyltransferase involved in cell wall biosynthesis
MEESGKESIAVVIPTYNRPHLLTAALASVFAQTRQPDELVVVDDGSSVSCEGVLAGYRDRVRYIYQENKGLSGARNTGIRATRSQLLAFLDDDDVLEPDHLACLSRALERDATVSVAYGDALYTDLDGRELGIHSAILPEIRDGDEFPRNAFCLRCFPIPSSVMFRRRVFEKHGLFDETFRHAEDVEMWLRIVPWVRFVFVDRIVCRYRRHEDSLVRDLANMESQLTRGLKERLGDPALPPEFRRFARTSFANLCLTQTGHYVRGGNTAEAVRCVGRLRRASETGLVPFWFLLLREFCRRRAVRWFRSR